MKSGSHPIRILCVDDHDLVRRGLAAVFAAEPDFDLVGEAATAAEGMALHQRLGPDVTLMDLRLPDRSGIEATEQIRAQSPDARVIMLSSYDGDQDVYRALEAGIRAYVLKTMAASDIVRAIRVVHAGRRFVPSEVTDSLNGYFPEMALTGREMEVLGLVARGFGNKEVGDALGTAAGTAKAHVQSILAKLEARDRTHAVAIGLRRGILHFRAGRHAAEIE